MAVIIWSQCKHKPVLSDFLCDKDSLKPCIYSVYSVYVTVKTLASTSSLASTQVGTLRTGLRTTDFDLHANESPKFELDKRPGVD